MYVEPCSVDIRRWIWWQDLEGRGGGSPKTWLYTFCMYVVPCGVEDVGGYGGKIQGEEGAWI